VLAVGAGLDQLQVGLLIFRAVDPLAPLDPVAPVGGAGGCVGGRGARASRRSGRRPASSTAVTRARTRGSSPALSSAREAPISKARSWSPRPTTRVQADGAEQPLEVPDIFVYRVRDGLVVHSRDYHDHLALAGLLGRVPELLAATGTGPA
jgi:hypothetical protein